MGARKCCLLQIPWPQALDPAVPHSNPAGTPATDFWPSWPGRTIGRRVVTYVPLHTHILGVLTYVCWQACGRKQLLTLLVALHSSLGPVLSSRSHGAWMWTKLWQPSAERRRDGVKNEGDKAGRDSARLSVCRCARSGHEGVMEDLYHWGPYYWLLGVGITGKHGVYSSIPVTEACITSKGNTMNEWDSFILQKPRAM